MNERMYKDEWKDEWEDVYEWMRWCIVYESIKGCIRMNKIMFAKEWKDEWGCICIDERMNERMYMNE